VPLLYLLAFFLFAIFILYHFNNMTNKLCIQKEIPEEKVPGVFRMINICITILLLSSYVSVTFT